VLCYSRRQFCRDFDGFDSCLQIVYTVLCLCIALFDAFQSSGKLSYYRLMPLLFGTNDLLYSSRSSSRLCAKRNIRSRSGTISRLKSFTSICIC